MDNHVIYVIHQNIQDQHQICIHQNYFFKFNCIQWNGIQWDCIQWNCIQLSLHEICQFPFDLTIQIHHRKDIH